LAASARSGRAGRRPVEPAEVVATIFHSLGSIWKRNCRARKEGVHRWSIGKKPIMELF